MSVKEKTVPQKAEKRKKSALEQRNRYGALFCLPFVIAFLIFNIYPVFRTFQMSFLNYKGCDATACKNYRVSITAPECTTCIHFLYCFKTYRLIVILTLNVKLGVAGSRCLCYNINTPIIITCKGSLEP